MDNERPNDTTSWSTRLEEPGALPGMGITDKEAAWDKLYDRLREGETPRRRSLVWFWAAAACLLLALVPAAFFLRDRNIVPSHSPEKISVPPALAIAPAPSPSVTSPQPHRGNDLGRTYPVIRNRRSGPARPIIPVRTFSPTSDTPVLHLVIEPNPDPSQTVATASALPPAPKKEWRVVHINELEPPQPAPSTIAGQRLKPGRLHFNLVPEETFRPSTSYTEPAGHPLISLKHAQNP